MRPARRHDHDFREVFLVTAGQGRHRIGTGTQVLRAGDLVWVRPGDAHQMLPAPGTGFTFVNVAFPNVTWDRFVMASDWLMRAQALDRAPEPVIVHVEGHAFRSLEATFLQAVHDFADGAGALALMTVLGAAARTTEGIGRQRPMGGPAWLTTSWAEMVDPDNLTQGVPRWVELAGVSAAHLSRTVKQVTGSTPSACLLTLRLDRAARMLAAGAPDVSEAAFVCGFDNMGYFYRCFQERYGMTPAAYRRKEGDRVV
jgi:AraC family cel operon transcriptional repressor